MREAIRNLHQGGNHRSPTDERTDEGGNHRSPTDESADEGGNHRSPTDESADEGGNHRSPTDESAVGAAVEPTRRPERASLSNAADPAASTAS